MGRTILVTGGLGFIGTNLLQYWTNRYTSDRLVVMDAMTYAAWQLHPSLAEKVVVEKGDISHQTAVNRIMQKYRPDHVIHLAAESHVCRSITGPKTFLFSNTVGTFHLLDEFVQLHQGNLKGHRFHHISTDEVFGELEMGYLKFDEEWPIGPRSPYATSKACSDLWVQTYHTTYGLDTVITNSSNNYGPYQHDEKLIPKAIKHILENKPVTIYGTGKQVRDWLYVLDHCQAIDFVFHEGKSGERYCVGGNKELTNLQVVELIADRLRGLQKVQGYQIINTMDRPTDDFRYALDTQKIEILGWKPDPEAFYLNLCKTIDFYIGEKST